MEVTMIFISIVLFIWGILEIILFFKIWEMTNNVSEILLLLKYKDKKDVVSDNKENENEQDDKDILIDGDVVHIGDRVIIKSNGKETTVSSVYNGKLFCKSSMAGYKYYEPSELIFKK